MEVSWAGELDYPTFIVTVVAAGERSGCLIGFATQASVDPAILLDPVEVGAGPAGRLSFHRARQLEPGHEA